MNYVEGEFRLIFIGFGLHSKAWMSDLRTTLHRLAVPTGLEGAPGAVSLRGPKRLYLSAPTARQLMARGLGWDADLNGLKYWARGLLVPGLAYRKLMAYWRQLVAIQARKKTPSICSIWPDFGSENPGIMFHK